MRIGSLKIEEVFAIIDWCMKKSFPDDYDARCLYSACAIHSIFVNQGIKSSIIGGNLGALTLSIDGNKALIEGFGGGDETHPSHYWVEANGIIFDINVSYLPKRSRLQAVAMPMVAWSKNIPLPNCLHYVEKIRYSEDVKIRFPDEIAIRMQDFIDLCKKRYYSNVANKRLGTWLLSNPTGLNNAARTGDKWARGAIRFQEINSASINIG
ncbi:hypothetical protein [Enterobacter cloacae complex sp. ESBL7]|uniref:hypothetical protein n=1 Tax=Enterobacter cloacae complex sp. ESBL7 TaxID=3163325 RepID=UPI003567B7D6